MQDRIEPKDRKRIQEDAESVCPRETIARDAKEVCPREAIERDTEEVCPRTAIERDAEDVCPRETIAKQASEVCPREAIERDAENVCPRPMPPIIGIVPMQVPDQQLLRVNEHYINSIINAGGVPLILPLTRDKRVYERLFPMVDGLVLTGGQDVDPRRYGEQAEGDASTESHTEATTSASGVRVRQITPLRDEVEYLILSFAYEYDVPLLGICRGMQMMNVFFGGTLYQDLATQFKGTDDLTGIPVVHWQTLKPDQPSHFVKIKRNSKLGRMLGIDTIATNSLHHQGICKLAPELIPAAYGSDGLVEALEVYHRSFMLGVQWHPEFVSGEKHIGCLFGTLVDEAAQARKSGRLDAAADFVIARDEAPSAAPAEV